VQQRDHYVSIILLTRNGHAVALLVTDGQRKSKPKVIIVNDL